MQIETDFLGLSVPISLTFLMCFLPLNVQTNIPQIINKN